MTILDMSVWGGVLIAAILLLRGCALHRLPKWTFLLLWGTALCRLLIPLSVPSPLSVCNAPAWAAAVVQRSEPAPAEGAAPSAPTGDAASPEAPVIVVPSLPRTPAEDRGPAAAPEPEKTSLSPVRVIYFTGAALCALFFTTACLRCLLVFRGAEAAEGELPVRWQEAHPRVRLRRSGAVAAPLTYGLFRPVILLPQNTDWSDEEQLTCVLTHEYIHIRRGDLFWKLLLAAALCVHWFNPLVWAMYFCANRDLELACDEAAIRTLGLEHRKRYALSLLNAEASRGQFLPLCSGYGSNQTEERILAVMKLKKRSVWAALTALILVIGTVAVFATGPVSSKTQPTRRTAPPDISQLKPARPSDPVLPEQKPEPVQPEPLQTDPVQPESDPAPTEVEPTAQPEPVTEPKPEPDTPVTVPDESDPETTWWYDTDRELLDLIIEARRAEWDAIDIIPCPDLSTLSDDELWQVPETRIPVANHQEEEALCRYLKEERGIDDITYMYSHETNTRYVCISYTQTLHREEARRALLPDGTYPVNSRGESYGSEVYAEYAGYPPDLVAVRATNGESGYILWHEARYGPYPGKMGDGIVPPGSIYPSVSSEDYEAYDAWLKTQPCTLYVPVYDAERTQVLGYFEMPNSQSEKPYLTYQEIQEIKDNVTRTLKWQGYSDEEIAASLEKLSASNGW